jgi:hypothetical protein
MYIASIVTTDPKAICTMKKILYRRYPITNNFSKFAANSVGMGLNI